MKQILTIGPDGSIQGLDHKRKGLDLRTLGRAEIRRATLIEWDEEEQAWQVFGLTRIAGTPCNQHDRWGQKKAREAGIDPAAFNARACQFTDLLLFPDYEDAVAFEVAVIQASQLKGEAIA